MRPKGQPFEQTGGEQSQNYQAGRDIIVHADMNEMREVALSVYKENALELRGIAEDVAYARADKLTNQFLEELADKKPEGFRALSDPDMQSVLFDAQSQYARSGEEDLGQVLVDLLADRAGESERNLQTLSLNEAIHSAPKLTEQQRRVVALIFVLRYSIQRNVTNAHDLYVKHLKPTVLELAKNMPMKHVDYQHIEYVGLGSMSIAELSFGEIVRRAYGGFFTKGFEESRIPMDWSRDALAEYGIRPALRDPRTYQLDLASKQDVGSFADRLGKRHLEKELEILFESGLMSPDEVVDDLAAIDPDIRDLARRWESSGAQGMTLTSVGIALGHAYWRRSTGQSAPLSVWL